jgi:hypothetical protein
MERFTQLFGRLLVFVYHCFDRIVIFGYLPLLSRPEHIVYFFRDVHGVGAITKEVLRKRTDDYNRWVDAFARNHDSPLEWAAKGVRKEDYVRPALRRMERQNRFGVYFILKSMELGTSFRSAPPKYPTDDPDYRILHRQRCRFTHYYFYIRDEELGALALCVASFLPFHTTYYLNGHHFIERELQRRGGRYRKNDNSFVATTDPAALQAAADRLSARRIQKRLDYWTLLVGPKFSPKDRQAVHLHRRYSINQVEYCRNFIFRRSFPIHKIFERSCELGLLRLSADKVSQIFGWRVHKRLRGKLETVLEKIEQGHHVLRAYSKNAALRMYQKWTTFLRVEVLSNRLKDFGLNKGLENLDAARQKLAEVTDRFAAFEAESLHTPIDFPLFQRLALPIPLGRSRVPGIKIHDTRVLRLMEVLLHGGTQITGWRSRQMHQAVLAASGLSEQTYTLGQLRYDLRKMKAHGLVERLGQSYCYRLTPKGIRVAVMFLLFHKRLCGPLAHSLFSNVPTRMSKPRTKIQAAYRQADTSIQRLVDLLAAA